MIGLTPGGMHGTQGVERERYRSNCMTQSEGYYIKGRTWQRGRKSHLVGVSQESARYQVQSDEHNVSYNSKRKTQITPSVSNRKNSTRRIRYWGMVNLGGMDLATVAPLKAWSGRGLQKRGC